MYNMVCHDYEVDGNPYIGVTLSSKHYISIDDASLAKKQYQHSKLAKKI
jgi:hypothetical protein